MLRHLLQRHAHAERVEPAAAVLLLGAQRPEARRLGLGGETREILVGDVGSVRVERALERDDLVLNEAPDLLAEQLELIGQRESLERGHGPRFYHHRGDPLIQLSPRLPARGERLSSNGDPPPLRGRGNRTTPSPSEGEGGVRVPRHWEMIHARLRRLHHSDTRGSAVKKRWSLSVPLEGFSLAELGGIAREAEELGYTDAWSYEVDGVDGFTPLAAIAAATTGMRLGIAIANVFTRGPATLASVAAGLARLAPRRWAGGLRRPRPGPLVPRYRGGPAAHGGGGDGRRVPRARPPRSGDGPFPPLRPRGRARRLQGPDVRRRRLPPPPRARRARA